MRENQPLPAQQLRSVADRYRRRTRGATVPRRPLPARPTPRAVAEPVAGGRDERMQRLEAVLFLAKEPLHSRKLSQYANLADGTEARTLASRLNDLYDRAGCAFRVEEVAGGLQLRTRPQFGRWLRRLQHVPGETRLSAPAMETLSVVAYRQPVMRADIEAVRGVACGEILRQLMERDLVTIVGRSEELGRPYLYGTTKKFLQLFGLRNLNDLPRADVFRESHRTLTNDKNTSNDPTSNSETSEGVTEVSATLDQVFTTTESVLAARATHDAFAAEDRTLDGQQALRAVDEDDDEWEDEDEEFDDDDDDDDEEEDFEDEDEDFEDDDDEEFEDDEEESEWEEVEDEEFEDEEEFDEELDDEELDDEELEDEELEDEEEDWDEEDEEDDEDDDDWDDEEEEEEEEEEDWE
jgi:segregation and condensation protein B